MASTVLTGRAGLTVGDAMLTDVKLSDAAVTVRELRTMFADEHVHSAVIVFGGVLLAVVDRDDLAGVRDEVPGLEVGCRGSRVIGPDTDLASALDALLASGRRRLAVATPDGRFRGLLCLKRSRQGFCSNSDVGARSRQS